MQKSTPFYWLIILLFCVPSFVFAQTKTQTIRGKVFDKETKQPLIGVSVFIKNIDEESATPTIAAASDMNGDFVLNEVPLGRQIIQAQYMGYEPFVTDNIIITSAKELFLEIGMIESVQSTGEVEISATGIAGSNRALNELSVVSTRSFSVEETQRYAASINDPGRMVMAFPGVQSNNDTENDIIVRGNSAVGVLWRLEGMDIPNPNHFARPATTGGGITIFSASLLSNSDFSTGAFAAEYGNALSAVFDMRFRKGNLLNREYTFRAGLIGLDFSAEGPIKKGRSSYLINYRYSTLGILGKMGFYVVRENVSNTFQDLSFNLYFSSPDNKNIFTVFGMGGLSSEHWWMLPQERWVNSFDYVWDINDANLGIVGATYTRLLDEKSFLKVTLGGSMSQIFDYQKEPLLDGKQLFWLERNNFYNNLVTNHAVYSRKISTKFRIKAGAISTYHHWNLEYGLYGDSISGYQNFLGYFNGNGLDSVTAEYFDPKANVNPGAGQGLIGSTFQQQAYFQTSYRASDKITLNAGLHLNFLALNNTMGIDPRVSMRYQLAKKSTVTLAYGLHSKALPFGTYLLSIADSLGNVSQPNLDLKMTKSHHVIGGFEQLFGERLRFQVEFYYQFIFNVPISTDTSSTYWFYNMRDNYGTIAMTDKGVGRNYGMDVTFEKFFGKGFFVIATGSLLSAKYKAWDDEYRSTRLDNGFSVSLMATKEFTLKKGGVLQIGIKSFLRGGLRYQTIDTLASAAQGGFVADESQAYDKQFKPYFRLDTRLGYRKDLKNLSYTISLDLQNATDQVNPRGPEYDRNNNQLLFDNNSGLLPVLSFQIDF